MEIVQGEVGEFKDIMGIINKEIDLASLSNANLRRVFTMFSIANGVAPYSQADVDGLWCSSVDGMVAVARQVIDYVREMTFEELDEQQEQKVLGMLRSACNIISKHCVLDSSQQRLLEKLELEVGLRTDERLVDEEDSEVVVVGDIHGQFHDLISLFEENAGFPSYHRYFIFNGNYIDIGSWCLEVLLVLLACKVMLPDRVYLLRGNHESKDWTLKYGFLAEVCAKFGKKDCKIVYEGFLECFKAWPQSFLIVSTQLMGDCSVAHVVSTPNLLKG